VEKRYVLVKDLNKITKKGIILAKSNDIVLVATDASQVANGLTLYTVWNPESGFKFTNTYYKEEAEACFKKYAK